MNMIKKDYKGNTYFQFKNLAEEKDIDHLFTSRLGWENEMESLREIFNTDRIISLKQVHGKKVYIVDQDFLSLDEVLEGDGLITDLKNVVLRTYHADCSPLYFYDREKKVVGLAHSGWRGSYENIMGEMIQSFVDNYSTDLKDLRVYIGPSIKSCCYEVGQDLYEKFLDRYPNYSQAFRKTDRYYLDLENLNYELAREYLKEENITRSSSCTSCNNHLFYSYRKENGTKGRMVTGISIK